MQGFLRNYHIEIKLLAAWCIDIISDHAVHSFMQIADILANLQM